MKIILKELMKKDIDKAADYAVAGMNFNRYTEDETELRLYGKYFVYLEMERATQIIAAYEGVQLLGVIMASLDNEKKKYHSLWKSLYIGFTSFIMKLNYSAENNVYDKANKQMLKQYKKYRHVDGEICFLAVSPEAQGKGIGGMLLNELSKREHGKNIFLFTDSNCTYEFYDHKGFERVGIDSVILDFQGLSTKLTCFLYAKML